MSSLFQLDLHIHWLVNSFKPALSAFDMFRLLWVSLHNLIFFTYIFYNLQELYDFNLNSYNKLPVHDNRSNCATIPWSQPIVTTLSSITVMIVFHLK